MPDPQAVPVPTDRSGTPKNIPLWGRFKLAVKRTLTALIGYENYLYWFARFKVATMSYDKRDRGLFYVLDHVAPDATLLDVGANIGVTTVLLARRVPKGRVHSFEPDPINYRILKRVVDAYRLTNVELHQMAVGDKAGEIVMVTPVWSTVRMHGLTKIVTSPEVAASGETFSVPMELLDRMGLKKAGPVGAIKIDVENHEPEVIEGARSLLATDRPMVYAEFWPRIQADCFRLMDSVGYDVFACDNGTLRPAEAGKGDGPNFVCLPKAKG